MKKVLSFLLFIFFCFPVFHLFFYLDKVDWSFDKYFFMAMRGSFVQSLISALGALFLGFFGSLGLSHLRRSLSPLYYSWFEVLVLIPSFVPPLVLVLLTLKGISFFPFGLWGVALFHISMHLGLVAVAYERILRKKALGWSELCLVEGVRPFKFIWKGLLPNVRPESFNLFIFVFISCFMSFSIPFLVGGIEYGGVEVFIYEKIFLLQEWGQALSMALSLTLFFIFASFLVSIDGEKFLDKGSRSQGTSLLASVFGIPWLVLPLLGLFLGLLQAWGGISSSEELWSLVRGTLILSLGCGLLSFLILSTIGFVFVRGKSSRFLFVFVPPGWMFIAFSLFLFGPSDKSFTSMKVIWGLALIFVPYLYRLSLHSALSSLTHQVDVARTMGVSWFKIYLQVLWPQLLPTISLMSGIAAFWAAGDFAISSVLFQEDISLALKMKSLMLNYRMDQALVLVPLLLLVSIVVFSVFQGMGYVCRRKVI